MDFRCRTKPAVPVHGRNPKFQRSRAKRETIAVIASLPILPVVQADHEATEIGHGAVGKKREHYVAASHRVFHPNLVAAKIDVFPAGGDVRVGYATVENPAVGMTVPEKEEHLKTVANRQRPPVTH